MLAFLGPGGYEWIVILIVALLLFGRRLPEVMRSMGQGVKQFKKGLNDVDEDVYSEVESGSDESVPEIEERDSDSQSSSG